MLQEMIVYIILAVAIGITIYLLIKRLGRHKDSPCDNCSGCELKEILKKGEKPPCK